MDPGLDDKDVCSYQAICVGGHLTEMQLIRSR